MFARKDASPLENARDLARRGCTSKLREAVARRAFALAFPNPRELPSIPGKIVLQRIATAIAIDPYFEVILLDEPLSVGDDDFDARCLERLNELASTGVTIPLATESPSLIESLCENALWIEAGRIAAVGESSHVLDAYRQVGAGLPTGAAAEATLDPVPLSIKADVGAVEVVTPAEPPAPAALAGSTPMSRCSM